MAKKTSVVANLAKKMRRLNTYGYEKKNVTPFSALKLHKVVFDEKTYNVTLMSLRNKFNSLKNKHRQIKELRLENEIRRKKDLI